MAEPTTRPWLARPSRERLVAGIDIGATAVRVALAHRDGALVRVVAAARESLPEGAVRRGVVRDDAAAGATVRLALAEAERQVTRRADLVACALGGDDLRTHHMVVRTVRDPSAPVSESELERATRDAAQRAARGAVAAVGDEPGLRRNPLQVLEAVPVAVSLDGAQLTAPGRQRGRALDVQSVASLVPLVRASGVEAALAPLRRSVRMVAGPLALGMLVATEVAEAIVVDVGADLTGVAVVSGGVTRGARSLSLGARALEPRLRGGEDPAGDARLWARCVALAASAVHDAVLPRRVVLCGGGARLRALADALEEELARLQGLGEVRAEMLELARLRRVAQDAPVTVADAVAVAVAYVELAA